MGSLRYKRRRWRRSGIRGASADRAGARARHRPPPTYTHADAERERALLTERARFARHIDIELRVACRMEAASRHELGIVAREVLRRRAYRRIGFVRLSDYARERVGLAARTLQDAAWVANRLDTLPRVADAFDRSDLSWAQVRAICTVARPRDQDEWLARARDSTVDELERAVAAARRNAADAADSDARDADAADSDARDADGGHTDSADRNSTIGDRCEPDDDDGTIDGEPAVRWRIACPARVRALWRRARELASRMAGGQLPAWRAAEIIAAEAFSGRPADASFVERALLASMRLGGRARKSAAVATPAAPAPAAAAPANDADAAADAFALDARLVAAARAIRTSEPRIGELLRIVVDKRVYRAHGFTSFPSYVRERLGISPRKAWALLKVERSTRRDDAFSRGYHDGTISWARALTLLPVVDRDNAAAWIARAEAVTVRRLTDEVNWILETRDAYGTSVPLDPPPLDAALVPPIAQFASPMTSVTARTDSTTPRAGTVVQIRAHASLGNSAPTADDQRRVASEVCDVEIGLVAPASVVALMREALDVFAEPGMPRWYAFERVLQHVITYWEASPRHRDPIFARDGWRCTVPGCSSRCGLHDHHLLYRSRGGGNEPTNRTAVCAAHHLHGIHTSTICAWGTAPQNVHWHLGIGWTGRPLLAYVGDRRCPDEEGHFATAEMKQTG